jgi:hypothetical protein
MNFNHITSKTVDSYNVTNKNKEDEQYAKHNFDISMNHAQDEYVQSLNELGTIHQTNRILGDDQIKELGKKQEQTRLGGSRRGSQNYEYYNHPERKPHLTRILDPDLYSNNMIGVDTKVKKSVGPLAGVSIDRFIPMVPCVKQNVQNPVHIVPQYWVHGGESTRTFVQNSQYLRKCGEIMPYTKY